MATETLADLDLTANWVDIVAVRGALASVDFRIQCQRGSVAVVHGGGSAPTGDRSGDALAPGDSTQANAANVWAKGPGRISLTKL